MCGSSIDGSLGSSNHTTDITSFMKEFDEE